MFSYFIGLYLLLKRNEQILNTVSHYLDHGKFYLIGVFCVIIIHSFEHFLRKSELDALLLKITRYSMRLAWPCFSVGNQAAVISLECINQHLNPNLFEYLTLFIKKIYLFDMVLRIQRQFFIFQHSDYLIRPKCIVVKKVTIIFFLERIKQPEFFALKLQATFAPILNFCLAEWARSDTYFYTHFLYQLQYIQLNNRRPKTQQIIKGVGKENYLILSQASLLSVISSFIKIKIYIQ